MIHAIDPLQDPRWREFVDRHPDASVFHTVGWLRALKEAYGYEPIAFTTSPPTEALRNGWVFCRVRSWLTGRRLVSLPFSDHCEPLAETTEESVALRAYVESLSAQRQWRCVETRSSQPGLLAGSSFRAAKTFCLHRLDLRATADELFRRFHYDCVQRKIRRAEREGLAYEAGRSELLLQTLYGLLRLTRRRHGLPPQPLHWLRSVVSCLGEQSCIRIAFQAGRPIAGILTLHHGKRVVYKYGGSDAESHHLGGMMLLFWRTIQEAKQMGAEELDLGRSDLDNPSLITFKDRWAAERSTLTYWRSSPGSVLALTEGWRMRYAKGAFARLPESLSTLVGRLLYRHIG